MVVSNSRYPRLCPHSQIVSCSNYYFRKLNFGIWMIFLAFADFWWFAQISGLQVNSYADLILFSLQLRSLSPNYSAITVCGNFFVFITSLISCLGFGNLLQSTQIQFLMMLCQNFFSCYLYPFPKGICFLKCTHRLRCSFWGKLLNPSISLAKHGTVSSWFFHYVDTILVISWLRNCQGSIIIEHLGRTIGANLHILAHFLNPIFYSNILQDWNSTYYLFSKNLNSGYLKEISWLKFFSLFYFGLCRLFLLFSLFIISMQH